MELVFLGTGGAWGLPEIHCSCRICREVRRLGEKRDRTSFLLRNLSVLLVDCGPDIRSQLARHPVERIDGVLITHEHGDHFIGLDELFAYKRNTPRDEYTPIPVYMSAASRETILPRFGYLEAMEVITTRAVDPCQWFALGEFEILPFKTRHGNFANGSVGYVIRWKDASGKWVRLVYTSDFVELEDGPPDLLEPDILVIQAFWLNEPENNRPSHMSFQRALPFIERLKPRDMTYLVHIGDADMVPGDPANINAKKYTARDPLRPPSGGEPYAIPLNHQQWQETVDRVLTDRGIDAPVTVASDDLVIRL